MKIHLKHQRLFINAGMEYPACYANTELLDTDKGKLQTTSKRENITCKHCLRIERKAV